jgi:hypothetical protein
MGGGGLKGSPESSYLVYTCVSMVHVHVSMRQEDYMNLFCVSRSNAVYVPLQNVCT